MTTEQRKAPVELFEEEFVVARGTAQVHWFVRLNDGWVHCASYDGARATQLDTGAGVVYRTRVDLDLALGTELMRVESRPERPQRRSAVEHLLQPRTSQPRKTVRRYFVVARGGRLQAQARDP